MYFPLWPWVRSERRRRRGQMILAAVVMAATTAVVLTATLGARRSPDAFERLRAETAASDVYGAVEDLAGLVGDASDAEALAVLRQLPRSIGADIHAEMFVSPSFDAYFPNFTLITIGRVGAPGADVLDQPVIVAGRSADPAQWDEVTVSEGYARALGARVGDRVELESASTDWVENAYVGQVSGPPDGPRIEVTVTGVGRTPMDRGQHVGAIFVTPAFVDRFSSDVRTYRYAVAQIDDLPAVEDEIRESTFGQELGYSYAAQTGQAGDGLSTIASGWWIVAALAGAAGLAVAFHVAGSAARAALGQRQALSAIGATRSQLVAAGTALVAPVMCAGVVVGVAASVVVSPRAMIGLAREIDPRPAAIVASAEVVVGGGLTMLLAAVMIAVVAALTAGRTVVRGRERAVPWPHLARPVAVIVGVRDALTLRRSLGRATPVLIAVAVAGTVAAVSISSSIIRLREEPELSGQGHGRSIDSGESTEVLDVVRPMIESDPRIEFATAYHVFFPSFAGGEQTTAMALDDLRNDFAPTTLAGIRPINQDEVALGPQTLDMLGLEVGDQVALVGQDGQPVSYEIVGSMLFPQGDFDFDDGVGMTSRGAERIIGDPHDTAVIHGIVFDWLPSVDAAAADASLPAEVYSDTGPFAVVPPPVANLADVAGLTWLLAWLFGLIVVAALIHGALVAERDRRRDVGTLQALGLMPSGGSLIVASHAAALLMVGIIVGVPLGAVVARTVWTDIATDAHVVAETVLVPSRLGLAAAGVIAAAAAATICWLSVRVRRRRPADALRTE